jgi:hypothetical protein
MNLSSVILSKFKFLENGIHTFKERNGFGNKDNDVLITLKAS